MHSVKSTVSVGCCTRAEHALASQKLYSVDRDASTVATSHMQMRRRENFHSDMLLRCLVKPQHSGRSWQNHSGVETMCSPRPAPNLNPDLAVGKIPKRQLRDPISQWHLFALTSCLYWTGREEEAAGLGSPSESPI